MRALALLLLSGTAFADRAVVVGRVGDGAWTDAPTEARSDQKAEVAVVVVGNKVLAPDGIREVRIAGTKYKTAPLTGRVRWSTVEPHGFRTSKATNGATSDYYSNVSTESRTFGRWLGYDHIDYFETVVREWGDAAPIAAVVHGTELDTHGLGTIRYKAEVEIDGGTKTLVSPGAESSNDYGITADVHRVSIRSGDDFLGWLSAYQLVPEVFGSAGSGRGHQTDRFTGADCADVMVGALRRSGRTDLDYTNVAGLPAYTTQVSKAVLLDDHGMPPQDITGVKPGDLIRIDYAFAHDTPRDWDHVAALWEDRSDPNGPFHGGPDGKLDGYDLVIHMGHPRLVIEPLANQSPATIDVLRWKAQK